MIGHVALVVCGAPLASRAQDIAAALLAGGHTVSVVATQAALNWVDQAAVAQVSGQNVRGNQRRPDQPRRGPEPDAVVVCPATLNTVGKIAHGLMDNYAVGVVCEAIGDGIPVLVFPMISNRLWAHPARGRGMALLREAGVRFHSVLTGAAVEQPVISGTSAEVVAGFDPHWVAAALT